MYKDRLDELLTNITVDDSLLHCRDMICLKHKEKISELYSTVITSCRGAKQGGGVGGVSTPPEFWMGGLNTCQPPVILRNFFLGGVGSP